MEELFANETMTVEQRGREKSEERKDVNRDDEVCRKVSKS